MLIRAKRAQHRGGLLAADRGKGLRGGDALLDGCVRFREDDGGAGRFQRAAGAGVRFLRERGLERRQGNRVA
jgi:hypothetical protein